MSTNLVSRDIFSKYWNILKRNYKDTQHTKEDYKLYYSIFKDINKEDFINAIKQVLLHNKYFPRIDEIAEYLPKEVPNWFDDKNTTQKLTKKEEKEMNEILKELGG